MERLVICPMLGNEEMGTGDGGESQMGFAGRRFVRSSLFFSLLAGAGFAEAGQPTGATPLGNPGDWVTTSDYPASALRDSAQGMVVFRVKVDPQGKPVQCVVDQSSGTEELDTATCNLITARARFSPATDARGRPVEGVYTNRVRWVLPKDMPQPHEASMEGTYVVEADGSLTDCKFTKVEGLTPEAVAKLRTPCMAANVSTKPFLDESGKPVRKLIRIRSSVHIEPAP